VWFPTENFTLFLLCRKLEVGTGVGPCCFPRNAFALYKTRHPKIISSDILYTAVWNKFRLPSPPSHPVCKFNRYLVKTSSTFVFLIKKTLGWWRTEIDVKHLKQLAKIWNQTEGKEKLLSAGDSSFTKLTTTTSLRLEHFFFLWESSWQLKTMWGKIIDRLNCRLEHVPLQ